MNATNLGIPRRASAAFAVIVASGLMSATGEGLAEAVRSAALPTERAVDVLDNDAEVLDVKLFMHRPDLIVRSAPSASCASRAAHKAGACRSEGS